MIYFIQPLEIFSQIFVGRGQGSEGKKCFTGRRCDQVETIVNQDEKRQPL